MPATKKTPREIVGILRQELLRFLWMTPDDESCGFGPPGPVTQCNWCYVWKSREAQDKHQPDCIAALYLGRPVRTVEEARFIKLRQNDPALLAAWKAHHRSLTRKMGHGNVGPYQREKYNDSTTWDCGCGASFSYSDLRRFEVRVKNKKRRETPFEMKLAEARKDPVYDKRFRAARAKVGAPLSPGLKVAGLYLQNTMKDTFEYHAGKFSLVIHRGPNSRRVVNMWRGWDLLWTEMRLRQDVLIKATAQMLQQLRVGLENVK